MMLNPASRIGFVALLVQDLPQMRDWYTTMLGLEILQEEPGRVLLGLKANHRVLVVLEAGGVVTKTPTAGLSAFALAVPTWSEVLQHVAWLKAHDATLSPWFKTGFSRGVRLKDPEGTEVILEYDEGPRLVAGRGYNFTNAVAQPLTAPRLPKPAARLPVLPPPTFIGRLVVATPRLDQTVTHIQQLLGFIRQQKTKDWAYLTVGDNTRHIGIEVQAQKLGPRPDNAAGAHYLSMVVPNLSMLNLLRMNLTTHAWKQFEFDAQNDYLMIEGPNGLTVWFSLA
ncbi:VOC family protein [Lacticaseibacillus jixianensis]|uniref:VOC family protein n=1 Tax=Lacticaseibacillus jixianensis TaxID=2486012 RepID=A0ABW4BA84_9LACO|nr:VOC family protein [Lacticaseibacillus jixianensis]